VGLPKTTQSNEDPILNSADVTISTVLGYVSSYIRPVKMGQHPVGGFVNTQVFVIDESWTRLTTTFLYSFWNRPSVRALLTVWCHFLRLNKEIYIY
jgi:hypothetical protein